MRSPCALVWTSESREHTGFSEDIGWLDSPDDARTGAANADDIATTAIVHDAHLKRIRRPPDVITLRLDGEHHGVGVVSRN
jgi:hypothetical protein